MEGMMQRIVLSELKSMPAESYGFSVSMGVKDDVVLTKGEKSYYFDYSKDAALFLLGYELAKNDSKYDAIVVNICPSSEDAVKKIMEEIQKAQKDGAWFKG